MNVVYALIDPRTDKPFYIGATGRPHQRLKEHLRLKTITSAGYIRELQGTGLKPKMVVLESFATIQEALAHERQLLRKHRKRRIPLVNNKYGRKRTKKLSVPSATV